MRNLNPFIIIAIVCLTFVSGARAQRYHFPKTYPPPDSGEYAYSFHAVDSWGEVCIAVGNKRFPIKTIDRNVVMVFRSTNGGVTWVEQDPGLPHERSDADG